VKLNRQERNELLKKLQIKLNEREKMGKSGIVELNVPKKPKRPKIKKLPTASDILKTSQPPKEKIKEKEDLDKILEGTIKWFSQEKGYGFLVGADGVDYFFHHTELTGTNYIVPVEGDAVFFKSEKGEKGLKATRVSKQGQ